MLRKHARRPGPSAVAVGGSVAVMHTASVLALGFVVPTVTEVFAPERVYPWLWLVSGLIAFALGAGLLVSRLGGWSEGDPAHVHDHPHREGASVSTHTHATQGGRPRRTRREITTRAPVHSSPSPVGA